jgi:hypothetical protein
VSSTNIDVAYYHLSLTIDFTSNALAGVVRVEGKVVGSPMSVLTLDLRNNMTVSAVSLAGGGPPAFARPGDALEITFPAPVPVDGAVAVDVAYSGTPIQTGFGSFVFGTRSGDRYAWSLSEPYGARDWWPCKDHPSDKADSVRVMVTLPSQYRVGSQGLLVSETTVGPDKIYDWKSYYPISNYIVSIAVSEYVLHQGHMARPPLAALYGRVARSASLRRRCHHAPFVQRRRRTRSAGGLVRPVSFRERKIQTPRRRSGGDEHQTMTSPRGLGRRTSCTSSAPMYGDATPKTGSVAQRGIRLPQDLYCKADPVPAQAKAPGGGYNSALKADARAPGHDEREQHVRVLPRVCKRRRRAAHVAQRDR